MNSAENAISKFEWVQTARAILEDPRQLSSILAQGRSHKYGLVTINDRMVFIKLCNDRRRRLRLANEYEWLQKVWNTDHRLVPEPLGYTESVAGFEALLITSAIAGRSVAEAIQREELHGDALRAFAHSLARFHQLSIAEHPIRFDGVTWPDWSSFIMGSTNQYLDDIESHGGSLPDSVKAGVRTVLRESERDLSMTKIGPVHGDPTFSNAILRSSCAASLVDFEVAYYGDSLMDLAITHLLEFSEGRTDWEVFTDAYGLHLDDETNQRLRLYEINRQVRLLRGKVWIYRDHKGYAKDLERLEQLLSG